MNITEIASNLGAGLKAVSISTANSMVARPVMFQTDAATIAITAGAILAMGISCALWLRWQEKNIIREDARPDLGLIHARRRTPVIVG